MKVTSVNRVLIVSLLLLFLCGSAHAQDSIKPKKIIFNGYVKDLQTVIFQDISNNWITGNLIHNRLNLKWLISNSFTATIEVRNRFFFGDMLTSFPGYNKTFESDNGVVPISKNLIDKKSFLFNTTVDRLWLQYSGKKVQLTLGRQRINWGQTFVWNPNDIFNSYSYFDFDYEERPGSDAFRMQIYPTSTSVFELAGKVNSDYQPTIAALYRFNKWDYDFQFLAGVSNQNDLVIGTGWSGQILKGGFRGEASYFHPVSDFMKTRGVLLASMGYDYTFKNSVFLQFEALYNGNYDTTNLLALSQLNNGSASPKNLFLSDFSVFASASYPFTPLFSGSLAAIANFKSKLLFITPALIVSLKENLELSFNAQLLEYLKKHASANDLYLFFARLKWSF
jgi:hypothetical protein